MIIKDDMLYTIKESAIYIGFSPRKLQRLAQRQKKNKIDGRYLFTGTEIKELREKNEIKTSSSRQTSKKVSKDDVNILKKIIEDLEKKLKEAEEEDDNDDMMEIPVEDYEILQRIILNEKVQKAKIEQLLERVSDHKNEIKYLRESLDFRNDQLDKLLSNINDSLKLIHQRNYIEAKDKGYDADI